MVLVVGGALVWRADRGVNRVPLGAAPRPVSVIEAQATTFRPSRSYVGTLEPWIEANVGPQYVAAYVETVLVRPGAPVTRGQILATLDCSDETAETQAIAMQARALDEQQRALADESSRVVGLLDGGFVATNEAERSSARTSSAQAAAPRGEGQAHLRVARRAGLHPAGAVHGRDRLALDRSGRVRPAGRLDRLRRRSRAPSGSPSRRPRRTSSVLAPSTVVQHRRARDRRHADGEGVAAGAQGRHAHAHRSTSRSTCPTPSAQCPSGRPRIVRVDGRGAGPRGGRAGVYRDGPQRQGASSSSSRAPWRTCARCGSSGRAAAGSTSTRQGSRPARASSPRGARCSRTATR